jgi:hypothetical protein
MTNSKARLYRIAGLIGALMIVLEAIGAGEKWG